MRDIAFRSMSTILFASCARNEEASKSFPLVGDSAAADWKDSPAPERATDDAGDAYGDAPPARAAREA